MAKSYLEQTEDSVTQDITWQTLYHADATLALPFQLTLEDSDDLLICEQMIRLVPYRRLVVFAKWQGQEVVAKLFFNPKKAKDTCFRDSRGVQALIKENIPTPRLLYKGRVRNQPSFHVMILEKIPNAKTVADYWHAKKSIAAILPLMRAVTIEIATHHVLGILQRDIHLKNFLVNDKGIYAIDGSKISKFDHPVSKKLSLKYFAMFLVQLGSGTTELRHHLFEVYAKSRGWVMHPKDIKQLQKEMQWIGQDLQDRYAKKIFRDCSLFKKCSSFTFSSMYNREYKSAQLMEFLRDPDPFFLQPGTTILKAGRSATVALITIDERLFVVKRYNIKHAWHWLKRSFRQTRAAHAWRLAQQLYTQGIQTPKPIAFIEHRFSRKSYFVMEYVTGSHLGHYSTENLDEGFLNEIATRLLTLLNNLKEMHLTHGDLKMTNILINGRTPILIDLDGMRRHRWGAALQKAFTADLKRFMDNWKNNPGVYALFAKLMKERMSYDITQK